MKISPPCYPVRPVNGGSLTKALPKRGEWFYEPKFNGWRTLVHVPTGVMFNRKNEPLSITKEFEPALNILKEAYGKWFEWLDCEALERRHGLGRGTLIVLDALPIPLKTSTVQGIRDGLFFLSTYEQRRHALETCGVSACGMVQCPRVGVQSNTVYLTPSVKQGDTLWNLLIEANKDLACEFYEGVVAKKADSIYPMQLRKYDIEYPLWQKHRWQF